LSRTPPSRRAAVYDRFSELVTAPAVHREAVLRLDPAALDLAWNALNLETTDWWRTWKHNWPE
jgi:hypothetical protein